MCNRESTVFFVLLLAGVVRCYITANPPIQFVMWTRDKHLLEPYETDGFAVMTNGSLLIDRVRETHQGMYTCTPYNVHEIGRAHV